MTQIKLNEINYGISCSNKGKGQIASEKNDIIISSAVKLLPVSGIDGKTPGENGEVSETHKNNTVNFIPNKPHYHSEKKVFFSLIKLRKKPRGE